jgi:integrase
VAKLAAGENPDPSESSRSDTVRELAEASFRQREANGVASVRDEKSYFTHYVDAEIGHLLVTAVRPSHIRAVLDAAVAKGLARNTIVHLRALLSRIFKGAWQDETIAENPVARVAMPSVRETRKERVILSDVEITRYLTCSTVDLELRLMSLVARVQGGMRTSDVTRWDWSMVDRVHFAECFVPRSKTGKPQRL